MENYLNAFNQQIAYTPYIASSNSPEIQASEFGFQTYKPEYQIRVKEPEVKKEEIIEEPEVVEVTPKEINLSLSGMSSTGLSNINYVANKLRSAGIKNNQLAAILSTIVAESGGNPKAKGDGGLARGLWQWHPDRYKAGEDLDSQVQLMLDELSNVNSSGWLGKQNYMDAFNGDDLWTSVDTLTRRFIRPANGTTQARKRFEIAQKILQQLNG